MVMAFVQTASRPQDAIASVVYTPVAGWPKVRADCSDRDSIERPGESRSFRGNYQNRSARTGLLS